MMKVDTKNDAESIASKQRSQNAANSVLRALEKHAPTLNEATLALHVILDSFSVRHNEYEEVEQWALDTIKAARERMENEK